LAQAKRTLSPSDFGFHNSIKRPGGQVVFLDFEYFGWDDPAKMISDFLLHPAMELNESLKRRFVAGILSGFEGYRDLQERLSVAYPLFGLKWCLIILNEFVPQKLLRRGFAGDGHLDGSQLQAQQLAKAQAMLENITNNYRRFPYAG
jgi:thiamine kinase-like enzyme